MVLESQLPHKIVNLLMYITNRNSKLTVLRGSRLSKTIQSVRLSRIPVSANPHLVTPDSMVVESHLPHKIVYLFHYINK